MTVRQTGSIDTNMRIVRFLVSNLHDAGHKTNLDREFDGPRMQSEPHAKPSSPYHLDGHPGRIFGEPDFNPSHIQNLRLRVIWTDAPDEFLEKRILIWSDPDEGLFNWQITRARWLQVLTGYLEGCPWTKRTVWSHC